MFDSLTIARQLTEAGLDRDHADAIAKLRADLTWRMLAVAGLGHRGHPADPVTGGIARCSIRLLLPKR